MTKHHTNSMHMVTQNVPYWISDFPFIAISNKVLNHILNNYVVRFYGWHAFPFACLQKLNDILYQLSIQRRQLVLNSRFSY